MNTAYTTVSPFSRLGYAFVGWLGGNVAANVFYLIWDLVRSYLLHGEPITLSSEWQLLVIVACACAIASLIGWLLVGLPFIFALPLSVLSRLGWPVILLMGTALGLAAWSLMGLVIYRGEFDSLGFIGYWFFLCLAAIISVTAFAIYATLIRRAPRACR